MRIPSSSHKGFSLLELSLVLTIIALLMAGILNIATQMLIERKHNELTAKMDAIESALKSFRKANNRLPCPALGSTVITTNTFGSEDAHPGTCSGVGGTNLAINEAAGVVPTRSLGLPDDDMFDPWGGRFTYAVDTRMTAAGAFSTYPAITTFAIGSMNVLQAATGNALTDANNMAVAIVLSHGPNGHGAYQISGVRKNYRSLNADEQMNCHCTNAAVSTPLTANFTQGVTTDSTTYSGFDDVLRYYKRSDFLAGADLTK